MPAVLDVAPLPPHPAYHPVQPARPDRLQFRRPEDLDEQRAIYPDGFGGLTTVPTGLCHQGFLRPSDCKTSGPAGSSCRQKDCGGIYRGVPLRMSAAQRHWLVQALDRKVFFDLGVSPYSGGLQGGREAKAGETSAYQHEQVGGWAQKRSAYNPAKLQDRQFTDDSARFNRMSVRRPL